MDLDAARAWKEVSFDETVTAWAQVDEVLFTFALSGGIHVVEQRGNGSWRTASVADPGITCLAVRADGNGVLLAAGHHDGSVSITRLSPAPTGQVAPQWTRLLHDGPVTDIFLDTEEQVITGSTDRTVCVTPLSAIQSDASAAHRAESVVQRLYLTLRCKGVRFDGVRTEREQEKLRRYAESAAKT
jgi:hypothetical protein